MRLRTLVLGLVLGLALIAVLGGATPASAEPAPAPSNWYVYHVVKPGEYVTYIARMYGVSSQSIINANGLSYPYRIYPHQVLVIPRDNTCYPCAPGYQYYVVRYGDTLSRIGAWFGVSWTSIANANGLRYPYIIRAGQTLLIPHY